MSFAFMRLAAFVLLAGLLGLASCINSNDGAGDSEAGNRPRIEARSGGTLRLPLGIESNDPAIASLDLSDPRLYALARCIEMPLQRAMPDGGLAAGLATNSVVTDDGKVWTFTLRIAPGQDAEPGYLGQLFIQHCKEILRGKEGPLRAQLSDLIAGASDYSKGKGDEISGLQLDGSTLRVSLTRPNLVFDKWCSQPGLGVLLNQSVPAAGFGPFGLVEISGDTLILKPNPDALDGQPLLAELHFVCGTDRARQLERFRSGELDAANLSIADVRALESDESLKPAVRQAKTAGMLLGFFDLHEFPWGDEQFQSKVGLRRAVNQALDLSILTEEFAQQFAAWRHIIAPHFEDYIGAALVQQPVLGNVQDAPAAAASLKQANHEQGNYLVPGMDLGYCVDGIVDEQLVNEILRYWRDTSVKMRPFPLTRAERDLRITRGSHEIILMRVLPAYPDVDAALYPFYFSTLAGVGGNYSLMNNKDVDRLLRDGQGKPSGAVRTRVYQDLCSKLETDCDAVLLGNLTPTLLISPKLAGYHLSAYDYDASLPAQDFAKLGFSE